MPALSHFWIRRAMRFKADLMLHEAHLPFLADRPKEGLDVGV
jgi:hypothetical protein